MFAKSEAISPDLLVESRIDIKIGYQHFQTEALQRLDLEVVRTSSVMNLTEMRPISSRTTVLAVTLSLPSKYPARTLSTVVASSTVRPIGPK